MQSTIPGCYSKTGRYSSETALSYGSQVTSLDLLSQVWSACKQMEGQRLADVWNKCKRRKFEPAHRIGKSSNKMKRSGRYLHFSSVTLQQNWNRMLSFWHFPEMNQTTSWGLSLVFFLHRLYFTLKKKAPAMSVTVSPCDLPIEWSLAARTLKDKPLKSLQCEWAVRPQLTSSWRSRLHLAKPRRSIRYYHRY